MRWQKAPRARDLGRVWITVVFAGFTIAGVLVVAVIGIRNGQEAVEDAERVESAVDVTVLMRRTVLALQDERGRAELWLTAPAPDVRAAYGNSQIATDEAVGSLRSVWQRNRALIDEVGPPTFSDVEEAAATLVSLRDATMHFREASTVDSYTSVVDVFIAAIRRVESIAEGSAVSSDLRSMVRIIEAGQALSRQRDIVTALLSGDDEVTQNELVRLLLLQQEARTNLASIRAFGEQGMGVRMSEFLAAMSSGEVQMMLETLESGEAGIDPRRWYRASSDRLESLRMMGSSVAADLELVSAELRDSAEANATVRTAGLSGLLVVSVVAGAAAIGVARERAQALAEHADLAKGLFEWFEPERFASIAGIRIVGRYDAASEFTRAGGDWYDVYRIPDGRVALTVGDVAGHGAAATAQMAQARYLLRGMTLAAPMPSPALQIADLDAALRNNGTMATIFHGLLDLERSEFVYTRAGHLPAIALHGDSISWLKESLGPPVGVDSEDGYTEVSLRLNDPWHLIVFTDGLVEERDVDIETALDELMRKVSKSAKTPDTLPDTLLDSRPSRADDAALLVVSSESGVDVDTDPEDVSPR